VLIALSHASYAANPDPLASHHIAPSLLLFPPEECNVVAATTLAKVASDAGKARHALSVSGGIPVLSTN